MDKDIVIHVGMHKTGSTFLQNKIFPNFEDWGFLTRPYTQHNHAFNKLQFADDSLYKPGEILEEISGIPHDRILISDESLTGKPYNWHFVNRTMIARRLHQAFPNAKIILFIRGQVDSITSHYKNYIQGHTRGTLPAKQFLWKSNKDYGFREFNSDIDYTGIMDTLYYNNNYLGLQLDGFLYYELIQVYKNLFKEVKVFLYEELRQNQQHVVRQIEAFLGTPIKMPDQLAYKTFVRKSLGPKNMLARVIENKVFFHLNNHRIAKLIGKMSQPLISAEWMQQQEEWISSSIEGYFEDNNSRIRQDFPEIGLDKWPESYPVSYELVH
jgi:hypothetical protein